ncbi:MAG: guanylate kinase [Fibromonadaceae bacterium]|jgi:guanylate kinase|nr:guanylate kinase [Fibromonadaceae bacterium]
MSTHKTSSLFIFSAASGAGKTTLMNKVMPSFPNVVYSVSVTTRKPRSGEVDGVHYFFKTEEEFKEMIEKNKLVEWNKVHGNYYGTPKFFIEQKLSEGKDVVFDLDVFGKINFDKFYPEAVGILILPPSMEELELRLRNRKTESEESLRLRMENAKKENDFALAEGKYEHVIYNGDLEIAAAELKGIMEKYSSFKSSSQSGS